MPQLVIDLSEYPDRFSENCTELPLDKRINFCFGRNGSGKSTIAQAVKTQCEGDYDVQVFDGFEGIVGENSRLDAVSLGMENAEIQSAIDILDEEIIEIRQAIEKPEGDSANLFTSFEIAEKDYRKHKDAIGSFFVDAAKVIKEKTKPQIAKTSYNRRDFEADMPVAASLSEEQISEYENVVSEEKKIDVPKIHFLSLEYAGIRDKVNGILQSYVSQNRVIEELENDTDKQNFAKDGIRIHKRGERCAFCDNEISDERWKLLGEYFNDQVKAFEDRIDEEIETISTYLGELEKVRRLDEGIYYANLSDQIRVVNLQIDSIAEAGKVYLMNLSAKLKDKHDELFAESTPSPDDLPADFTEIVQEVERFRMSHNRLTENLEQKQAEAKQALRLHEVSAALKNFSYEEKNGKASVLKSARDDAEKRISDKKAELIAKQGERQDLISQTKNEEQIAKQICDCLESIGSTAFTLELIEEDDEEQKGQYKIRGHNGELRPITNLSKGEKNIIGILFFIFSLSASRDDSKPRIIVLDDPMTSNDDTMQYLMIGEIQKLYSNIGDGDYFILLTHNCHFYLNIRKPKKKFYSVYGNHFLLSDGKHTTILCVDDGDKDFKTNYEMLWKELKFLYEANRPNLMLGSCRRICETFQKFNSISQFYDGNSAAKKLFNVNVHSIDDLESEQNAKTREEILSTLKALFEKNKANEHFHAHWGDLEEAPVEEDSSVPSTTPQPSAGDENVLVV